MADYTYDILKAIRSKLLTITAITAVVDNRIFSSIQKKEIFPYIYISLDSKAQGTFGKNDFKYKIQIQTFSESLTETLTIRRDIFNALDRVDLTVGTETSSYLSTTILDSFKEPDGEISQSVIIMEMLV